MAMIVQYIVRFPVIRQFYKLLLNESCAKSTFGFPRLPQLGLQDRPLPRCDTKGEQGSTFVLFRPVPASTIPRSRANPPSALEGNPSHVHAASAPDPEL